MTPEQTMDIARQAGFLTGFMNCVDGAGGMPFVQPVSTSNCLVELQAFAALVAAHQRELDARVCDVWALEAGSLLELNSAQYCAAAVRGQVISEPAR